MSRIRSFFMASVLGAVVAAMVCGVVVAIQSPRARVVDALNPGVLPPEAEPALRYARALQEGNWEEAVALTQWMQERLERVAADSTSDKVVTDERKRLVDKLSEWTVSENQVRAEGIEDQYIFSPGSTLAAVRVDGGRPDLEAVSVRRVWLRVTYPEQTRAPRDMENRVLRSLTVGVNVSEAGRVLKANVLGNLEIDWSSALFEWGNPREKE
ncbi:MAG: hypothetical protein HYV26_14815 [Candidatus Hydrogenedentes bacterium]|nr:hypothetical protein [Candidatus Hydrogenedentota bacterium]